MHNNPIKGILKNGEKSSRTLSPPLCGIFIEVCMAKRKMTEKQLANLQTDKYKFSKNNPEIAQKCQELSVKKRKENQSLADLMKIELQLPDEETGEMNNIVITKAMVTKAKKGDVSAYQTIRDTIGEKPTDKQEITTNQPTVNLTINKADIKEIANDINDLADE